MRVSVLVEGASDRAAVEALAAGRGVDLDEVGVSVVSMVGATSIWRFLERFTREEPDVRLTGLCDAGEEGYFRRGLERAGLGVVHDRAGLESLGFFVCEEDLEDELIRTLGVAAVERVIEAAGETRSLRALQKQPAQRDRSPEQQVRRFFGSGSGRKIRYARLLVEALAPEQVPRPLDRLLLNVLA
ncbi:hypothetical protein BH10ACT10_BH10ACT10_08620 [soil metagenome]